MKVDRICLIDPKNNGLKLVVSFSENIMAALEIKFLKSDKSEYKTIKTSIAPNSKFLREITIEPMLLHKGYMVWNVVLCSSEIKTENATFDLTLQQNLQNLRPNIPTSRNLSSIPPCRFNKTIDFTDSLMFMVKGL